MINTLFGILVILACFSSPAVIVYLVVKFIKWQDNKKRTWGGVIVSGEAHKRLMKHNIRADDTFWGDNIDLNEIMKEQKRKNIAINRYVDNNFKNMYLGEIPEDEEIEQ